MTHLFLALIAASGPLHLKVDGDGYLRLMKEGHPVYAREADLAVVNGLLGSHGATFLPAIHVSGSLAGLGVDLMGNLKLGTSSLGRLVLALPTTTAEPEAGGFFTFSDRPKLTNPGEDTAGVTRLEGDSAPVASASKTPPTTQPSAGNGGAAPKSQTTQVASHKTFTPSASGKLEVLVHVHSEVGNQPFTLADVAELKGPDELVQTASKLVLANAPAIGIKRLLDDRTLGTLLRGTGIQPQSLLLVCPQGAYVVQKSQTITGDAMTKAALDAITAKYGGSIPLVVAQKLQDMVVAEGQTSLDVSEPEAVNDGYYVTVTARVGTDVAGIRSFTLVPSKDAPRIKQNDPVTVVLISGSASVEVAGRAKAGGYVGQRIEVIIDHVGNQPTTHVGVLVSTGRVEVQL